MRHRSRHLMALLILVALSWGLLSPTTALAADTPRRPDTGRVTFGLQPSTKGMLDSRTSYRYGVTPGGRLSDQVAVRNLSDVVATFGVYTTDAVNVDNGSFGLLPKAQRALDVGRWLAVGGRGFSGSVTVKPRSEVFLPLSLAVPADAQPGDHSGGVIVSLATRGKQGTTDVVLDQRVGARVFIRVSGPQRPSLTIAPVRARYQGSRNPFGTGQSFVTYKVTNTGNINLGGRQRVVVRGLVGPAQRSTAIVDLSLLLPGGSAEFTTRVAGTLPMIRERVQVAVIPLVQQGDQVSGLRTYTGTATFTAVPWTLLGLILLLGLAAGRMRRVRRGRRLSAPPGQRPVVLGEHRAARLGAATTLSVAAIICTAGGAHAADVPYDDTAAKGGITLCDARGTAISSGAVEVSVAAKAVGGSGAPAPYDGPTRSAGLFAYQPREGVLPGQWSGQGLTALSRYTDKAHPAVEILPRDYTLSGFMRAYPLMWDNLVQLRIYLRVAGAPTNTSTYSATTLRVTGNRWRQVGPTAGASCGSSEATSVLRLLGLPTASPTVPTTPRPSTNAASSSAATAPVKPSIDATTTAGVVPSSTSSAMPDPASTVAGATTPTASRSAVGESKTGFGWAVAVVALLLVASLAWVVGRDRWGRATRT